MADQELGLRFKTTSDVPEQVGKAKSAVVSFAKQVEDIQKKFSTSFKDIFLSIVGPMAIFAAIQNTVVSYFDKIKKAQEDANQAAIEGTNKKMAAEDVYYARRIDNIRKERLAEEQSKLQPVETTKQFLLNDPRAQEVLGKKPFDDRGSVLGKSTMEYLAEFYSKDPAVQQAVRKMLEKDLAAGATVETSKTPAAFKTPEGFSNVVGVGSNPVIEAMNAQLEEAQKQTALLEKIASPDGGVPKDFTKDTK